VKGKKGKAVGVKAEPTGPVVDEEGLPIESEAADAEVEESGDANAAEVRRGLGGHRSVWRWRSACHTLRKMDSEESVVMYGPVAYVRPMLQRLMNGCLRS
jgi:hypothetical protein